MARPLEYSLFPHTDVFGTAGYILSVRNPYTGQCGQGFFERVCDAHRAVRRASDRLGRGDNPLEYFDSPYVQKL